MHISQTDLPFFLGLTKIEMEQMIIRINLMQCCTVQRFSSGFGL